MGGGLDIRPKQSVMENWGGCHRPIANLLPPPCGDLIKGGKANIAMPKALGYSLENYIRGNRMQLLKRRVTAAALATFQALLYQAFSGGLAAVALAEKASVA